MSGESDRPRASMMSDDFGSKSNDEKARQEAVTILWTSRRCLRASLSGTYCERPCREVLAGTPRTLQ